MITISRGGRWASNRNRAPKPAGNAIPVLGERRELPHQEVREQASPGVSHRKLGARVLCDAQPPSRDSRHRAVSGSRRGCGSASCARARQHGTCAWVGSQHLLQMLHGGGTVHVGRFGHDLAAAAQVQRAIEAGLISVRIGPHYWWSAAAAPKPAPPSLAGTRRPRLRPGSRCLGLLAPGLRVFFKRFFESGHVGLPPGLENPGRSLVAEAAAGEQASSRRCDSDSARRTSAAIARCRSSTVQNRPSAVAAVRAKQRLWAVLVQALAQVRDLRRL